MTEGEITMVVLCRTLHWTHLWSLKKNRSQVILLILNPFRERDLGRWVCGTLLKVTQVCCTHKLAHDF